MYFTSHDKFLGFVNVVLIVYAADGIVMVSPTWLFLVTGEVTLHLGHDLDACFCLCS